MATWPPALRSKHAGAGVFFSARSQWRILGDGAGQHPVDGPEPWGTTAHRRQHWHPFEQTGNAQYLTGVTSQMINILTEQNVQQSLQHAQSQTTS